MTMAIERGMSGYSCRAARLPGAIGSHENWGRQVLEPLARADRRYHRDVAQAVRSDPSGTEAAAGERYLLLADISGYTGFMTGVEEEHGVDFSNGIPAAYSILA